MDYEFQFHYIVQAWPILMDGLKTTVQLTVIANIIALG